jgi:hypothetical protein
MEGVFSNRVAIARDVFCVALGCAFLLLYISYPFSFNYETTANRYYLLTLILFAGVSIVTVLDLSCLMFGSNGKGFLQAALISSLMIFFLSSPKFGFSNEYFSNILVVAALGLLCMSVNPSILKIFIPVLLLIWLYELYLGFTQIAVASGNYEAVAGSFGNSGIYAIYLVVHFPLLAYFVVECRLFKKPLFVKVSLAVLFILAIWIVVLVQSRTALVSLFGMIAFYIAHPTLKLFAKLFTQRPSLSICLLAASVIALSFACWYLFAAKKLSALGRIMMFDITADHLKENFWYGVGPGWFTWHYPQWQQEYFLLNDKAPLNYYLSAGETYLAFNEHLQLFASLGCIGFVLYVAFLVYFYRATSARNKALLFTLKVVVCGLLIAGLTSYPYHTNILTFLMMVCLVVAEVVRDNRFYTFGFNKAVFVTASASIVLLAVSLWGTMQAFEKFQAKLLWDKLSVNNYARTDKKLAFDSVAKKLETDGKFMTEYGEFLSEDSSDCEKAVLVMEQAKRSFLTPRVLAATGSAYAKTGNYKKAIENFEWLSHYLPNRFMIKLELMKMYAAAGNRKAAIRVGNTILTMPVKIESNEVDEIKAEVNNILNAYKYQTSSG